MPECVIADASVLIILDKIDRFEILKGIYKEIYTTPEIANEYNKTLPGWIIIESVEDKRYQTFIQTQFISLTDNRQPSTTCIRPRYSSGQAGLFG